MLSRGFSTLAIWLLLTASWARADGASDQLTRGGIREFTAAYQA